MEDLDIVSLIDTLHLTLSLCDSTEGFMDTNYPLHMMLTSF